MAISLEQFKNNTLGGSYGNPDTGTYKGQCVSYVRQYMEQVFGIPTKPNGNAVDYYNSAFMAQYFNKVSDRKDGDILCWGDDAGSWTGPEGHIGISYQGKILNQNYGGSLKVTINDFFPNGYQGALRLKEKTLMVDRNLLFVLFRFYLGRQPDEAAIKIYVGKPLDTVLNAIKTSAEFKGKIAAAKIGRLDAKNHLPTEIRTVYIQPGLTQLKPGKYEVK